MQYETEHLFNKQNCIGTFKSNQAKKKQQLLKTTKMKNQKKISLLLIVFLGLTMIGVQSCKKYPDGPILSLRSRAERVANTWKVDNYKKNGNDFTSLLADYTETYTKDGGYSYLFNGIGGAGNWTFQNNDNEILLTGTNNQDTYTLVILKLEEKEFWYYYMDGVDRKEFHMIPK